MEKVKSDPCGITVMITAIAASTFKIGRTEQDGLDYYNLDIKRKSPMSCEADQ
jgi:hypothetical protein